MKKDAEILYKHKHPSVLFFSFWFPSFISYYFLNVMLKKELEQVKEVWIPKCLPGSHILQERELVISIVMSNPILSGKSEILFLANYVFFIFYP